MTTSAHPVPSLLGASLLRVTADQYHTMIADGIIPSGAPYELLDGFVVHKDRARLGGNILGHDPVHVLAINRLSRLAVRLTGSCFLQLQLPIALSDFYEPEPDAAIIRGEPDDYRKRLAGPSDVSCVIEAAHSSLARDAETKLEAYAEAGIPQYVILDLQTNTVQVHIEPNKADGTYRSKVVLAAGASISLYLPDGGRLEVLVSEMLP